MATILKQYSFILAFIHSFKKESIRYYGNIL